MVIMYLLVLSFSAMAFTVPGADLDKAPRNAVLIFLAMWLFWLLPMHIHFAK